MLKEAYINQLILEEGLCLKPYRCSAGKLTIGVGRNLDDNGISKQEALFLFKNDVALAEKSCRQAFDFFDELDETRQNYLLKSIEDGVQTIITSVDTILFEEEFLQDVKIYTIEGGAIKSKLQ